MDQQSEISVIPSPHIEKHKLEIESLKWQIEYEKKLYDLQTNGYYKLRTSTTIESCNISENHLKNIGAKPYIEPISQQPIKKLGMSVKIKSTKKDTRKIEPGCIVFNRKSSYYGIVQDCSTTKVFVLESINATTTIKKFSVYDANMLDLELFEGTITLENEK